MWAVIGLGNPGRRYSGTRHNVGFSFVARLARASKIRLKKRKFRAKIAELEGDNEKLVLAQPQTYMNTSGLAVKQIVAGFRLSPDNIVVVYDDLDIPLGEIRVRKEGSAGNHKGMRSVIQEVGSQAIPRIRIGIGPLADRADAVGFVLSPFTPEEIPALDRGLAKTQEALAMILDGRIEAAMNIFNKKEKGSEEIEKKRA